MHLSHVGAALGPRITFYLVLWFLAEDLGKRLNDVLDAHVPSVAADLDTLLAADAWARNVARKHVGGAVAQRVAV